MKTIQLSDGTHVPWLAFGTGTALFKKDAKDSVQLALERGFTHLDGAQMYGNEDSLGAAFAASGKPRSAVYITTKLINLDGGQTVRESLEGSLKKLNVDYVDLFLIHTPAPHGDRLGEVWKGMVEVKKMGLTKSIGVSNFNVKNLNTILTTGLEAPVVNQIEFHPYVLKSLEPLLDFQAKHGIVTASFGGLSPILPKNAQNEVVAANRDKLSSILDKLAATRSSEEKPITQNQVLLKWLQKKGVIAVTTSYKASRLDEYLATESIPDLTDQEVAELETFAKGVNFRAFSFVSTMNDQTP